MSGWRRGLGAAVATPAAAALYLSLSRGSLLVAALGLAVLGVSARSASSAGRLVIVALPPLAAVLLAVRIGTFGEPGATVGEVASIVALTVLAIVGTLLALRPPTVPLPRVPRREAIVLGAAVGVLAVLGATLAGPREESRRRPEMDTPDRLFSTSTSSRGNYWNVAIAMAEDAPVVGAGAGGFERTWLRERPALLYVRDAHNLYLETLAELGVVGLVLLLIALLTPLLGLTRAVRAPREGPHSPRTSPCWPTRSSTGTGSFPPSRSTRSSSAWHSSEWGASARLLAPLRGRPRACSPRPPSSAWWRWSRTSATAPPRQHRTPSIAATRPRRGGRPTARADSRPGPRSRGSSSERRSWPRVV